MMRKRSGGGNIIEDPKQVKCDHTWLRLLFVVIETSDGEGQGGTRLGKDNSIEAKREDEEEEQRKREGEREKHRKTATNTIE